MAGKVAVMKRANITEKTFNVLYEEFQQHNKVKNLRSATIEYYYNSLKEFRNFLIENDINYIREIQRPDIDRFILYLHDRHVNPVTVNTYLRGTRAFLNYGMGLNYLPAFQIKLVKQDKPAKETYSTEDIEKLVKKPDLKNCSFAEYRNWVMVQYFLETGNRLNTVINMRVSDINLSACMAILKTTKNRKQMFSPIGKSLSRIISEYIRTWGLGSEDYLFPNSSKDQLKKNSIQNAIVRYNKSRNVGLTSIHAFRHTFAKNYIMSGGNAFKLQRLLGHSSLEITQQYVSLFAEDLAEDFSKHSIIEQFSSSEKIKRLNHK